MCGQDGCLGHFYNLYIVMLKALFDYGGLRLEDLICINFDGGFVFKGH